MASVGPYLRELREKRGISLDEVARATRIAPRYLEALEADEHSALPEHVFTKGFIRAYCQVLGEPPDEAFARFAGQDATNAVVPVAPPAPAAPPTSRMRGTIIVSFVLLLILGAALLALTWALQSSRETPDRSGGTATREARPSAPTPSSGSPPPTAGSPQVPPSSLTPSLPEPPVAPPPQGQAAKTGPTAPEVKGQGTPAPPVGSSPAPPASSGAPPAVLSEVRGVAPPYRLVARAREATWMSVKTRDGKSTEETIPAGETREWASNAPFVITIGNAGGVSLELNGRSLPALGARGAAVFRIQIPPEGP